MDICEEILGNPFTPACRLLAEREIVTIKVESRTKNSRFLTTDRPILVVSAKYTINSVFWECIMWTAVADGVASVEGPLHATVRTRMAHSRVFLGKLGIWAYRVFER